MKNLKTLIRICLAVAVICLLPQRAQATHIVGGNMEYDILDVSNDSITVRIKLTVYRDCFFGDPAVYFDNPAHVGIFDQNNFRVTSLQLPFTGQDDTLSQGLDSFCLVNLQPVCVHATFYQETVRLRIRPGGYTFAYQRCCRNQTINNINDPTETGATFIIRINDAAIARANNSPEYLRYPPIYVCANEPFLFQNTAVDVDGDSLVYSLCTPFEGGTINNPQPIPTFPPPYDTLVWATGYSLDNLLGTGQPLAINPQTGLMTALPMTLGQFVIGVCVREYDRETGELLSIARRDFQYNVNPCDEITANFEAPDVQCDDLTVLFENNSTSPDLFEWYINGVLFSTTDTAFLAQTFPDTGSFNVQLIAVPNTICADTFSQNIRLVNNSIVPDFFLVALNCVDSTILSLTDISLDTVASIESYLWLIEYNGLTDSLTGPSPEITLPSDVNGTVTLIVTNTNGCEETFVRDFDSTTDNPTDFILAERDVCAGDTIQLNPFAPDSLDFNYQWAPAEFLDDPNAQNPIAMIDVTTTFSVTITSSTAGCSTELETTITILESPTAAYNAVPECGGITYVFNNTSTDANSYFYDFGVEGVDSDTSDLASPTFTFPGPGVYTVTFVARNASGCTDTLRQDITVNVANQIGLTIDNQFVVCESLLVLTPTATSVVIFTYFDVDGNLIGTGSPFEIQVSGTQVITVVATDGDGCTEQQTVIIQGGPIDVVAPDTVLACGIADVLFDLVNLDPNDTLTYEWSPDSLFDPATINDAEPVFTGSFGEYEVSVIVTNQFGCADTFSIILVVQDDAGQLSFTWEPDCSGSTIEFMNTSTVGFGFLWDFAGLGTSIETNPSFTFPGPGTYPVTLSSIYGSACLDPVTIDVVVTDVVLLAGILVDSIDCSETGVDIYFSESVLNLTGDELTYIWTFEVATPPTSTDPNPVVTVDQSGDLVVTLIVTSEDGCVSSYDTTINVQLATIDLPTEVTICPGDSIELNPNFSTDFTYLWSPALGFDPNEANPVATEAASYTVIVTPVAGDITCQAFDTITVIIADSIEMFLNDPDGNPIVETVGNETNQDGSDVLPEVFTCGDTVAITAVVDNDITVIWTDMAGNTVFTANPGLFDPVLRDTVIAVATDEFGCTVSDTVVIVNQQVDAMADPPSAMIIVCESQDTVLGIINLDPNDTLTYAWEDNPIIVSPLDSNIVVINPQGEGTIMLDVVVTNQFGCDTTITFTVTVQPFIPNTFPDTVMACYDQPTDLNPGGVVVDGYTYDWTPMDGDFSNPANPQVILTMDQTYTVVITDPVTGCMETDSIVVIVSQDLMFMADGPQDTTLCLPGDVTFMTTHAAGVVVSWYDDAPLMNLLAVGDDYTVSLTSNGEVITVYAEAVDTVSGCRDTLVFRAELLNFNPNPFPDTVFVCYNQPTDLNPGGVVVDGYTYTWTPMDGDFSNPANPQVTLTMDQTYTVVITDPVTGCMITDSIVVIVSPDLMFMADSPQDTTLCLPGDVTFMTTHAAGVVVSWYDDAPLMNLLAVGDDYTVTLTTNGEVITVYAEAVDTASGCRDTLVFRAELLNFDPGMFPDTVEACYGEDTPLNPGGVTNPDYIYQWDPDLGNTASPTVNLLDDATYTVTVTDPATGCELVDTVFVSVSEFIDFSATPMDSIVCEPTTYTVVSTNSANASVVWYSDPGFTMVIGMGATVEITVTEPGTVTIYGVATEPEFGCTEVIEVTATLSPLTDGLPNANPQGCFGGGPVSLFSNGTNPDYIYTYVPADAVDLSDPNNPVWNSDASGQVLITVFNPETGCTVEVMVQVDITDLTNLFGSADPDTIILGESTELMVEGCDGDCFYDWMEPNGTIDVNGSMATGTPDEEGNLVYLVEVNSSVCSEIVEIPVFVIDVLCVPDRVYLPNAFSPNNDGVNDELRLRSTFINQIEEFELMIFNRWGQQVYRSFNALESWDGTFEGETLSPNVYGFWMRVVCPTGEELIQKGNITILR